MTQDYGYKATLEADCGAKRFVAYHDDKFMEYSEAGEEAKYHLTSQSCPRCREHHSDNDYFPIDVQRGETGQDGDMYWRDAYPTRVDEWAHPELFA